MDNATVLIILEDETAKCAKRVIMIYRGVQHLINKPTIARVNIILLDVSLKEWILVFLYKLRCFHECCD